MTDVLEHKSGETSTTPLVSVERNGPLAIVTINNPPVNILSRDVRSALLQVSDNLNADLIVTHVVFMCAGKTFISGGDITEFDGVPPEPHLPEALDTIENMRAITIALIQGNCFGGGLELALSCDYRLALENAQFAFPEVNLGLIPGAGGTQRLPRLIGLEPAARMLSTGRPVDAKTFESWGGIDGFISEAFQDAALKCVSAYADKPVKLSMREVEADDLSALRKKLRQNPIAPHLNIDAAYWSTKLPYHEAQPKERALHLKLRQDPQSKALRHIFFAERKVAKPQSLKGHKPNVIQNVAVIGGGLMGVGIAMASLMAGFHAQLLEQDDTSAQQAKERLVKAATEAAARGKLSFELKALDEWCQVTSAMEHLARADLVIEAVFEDLAVKTALMDKVALHCSKKAILATNTSYLDPQQIFPNSLHHRALGLHFFAPAQVMKLVEVIGLPDTDPQVLSDAFGFVRSLGKIPVQSGICDGFIGNRILAQYRRQADYMLADGALPHEIDHAMEAFGMPMGPYALQDRSGLQIAWSYRQRRANTRPYDERYVPIADMLCEQGRFGKRSEAGWYDYENGKAVPSDWVESCILDYASIDGLKRRQFEQNEIQQRLIAVMANEAFLILQEGIAQEPSAIDVVKTSGFGFPRWLGGPVYYAHQHKEALRSAMHDVAAQSPSSWTISKEFS